VIPVSAYPKTTSGKVQRFILSNHYIAGKYTDTLAKIKQLSSSELVSEGSAEGSIEQPR
jgi:hypothetical protein